MFFLPEADFSKMSIFKFFSSLKKCIFEYFVKNGKKKGKISRKIEKKH